MTQRKALFEEKQFLGLNKYSLYRRAVFILFCILIYFSSSYSQRIQVQEPAEDFLLILGIVLIGFSVLLLFILHFQTSVYPNFIELKGFWTARLVKIPLATIESAEKIQYSRNFFNRPVYNLHINGKIKFFTRGKCAVQLTDFEGTIYIIGSQQPDQLLEAILSAKENIKQPNTDL